MQIKQDFIPVGRRNRPGGHMTPKSITIHDTQNLKEGADAESHARFLKAGAADVPASWHFTVDHDSIVQHLPLNESAFHAGDGPNGPGNTTSLAVEITENPDGNRAKAEQNAAILVASLLKTYNLGLDRVVQHHWWSGKDCPRVLRSRRGGWEGFIKAVKEAGEYKMKPEDANKIIAAFLGPMYNFVTDPKEKAECQRLADELRKASGQKGA